MMISRGVVYSCGHRGLFRTMSEFGDIARIAASLSRHPCQDCGGTVGVNGWIDRQAAQALLSACLDDRRLTNNTSDTTPLPGES